jgi:CRISPR-associated endonuclease/helicase Cas3
MYPIAHGPDHALAEHLFAVAAGAARSAPAGGEIWAHLAGLWHDLGKFRPGFQRYIREDENAHIEGRGVGQRDKSHSAAGAMHALWELRQRFGEPGRQAGWLLAHLIAAHHAGLYDAADLKNRLLGGDKTDSEREHREAVDACAAHWPALLAFPESLDAKAMLPGIPGLREYEPLAQALWLRMLFSALVDADFLDTEAYLNRAQAERRAGFPPLAEYLARLDAHLDSMATEVLAAGRAGDAAATARDFGAYSVAFDGRPLEIGESTTAAPGVTLIRRC